MVIKKFILVGAVILVLVVIFFSLNFSKKADVKEVDSVVNVEENMESEKVMNENSSGVEESNSGGISKAVFAGGCFWCMEHDFEDVEGVLDVVSGYMGGEGENPTYQDYSGRGFVEVIEVTYDSSIISYGKLLEHFWVNVDPMDGDGQFCDRGHAYISVIYYGNENEKKLAEESRDKVNRVLDIEAETEILPAEKFWEAEDYHQDYSSKNPLRYKFYRGSCGRDSRLDAVWGGANFTFGETEMEKEFVKPTDEELKKSLSAIQYKVTQKNGTERAFDNEYWDNHEEGLYVDLISGEVLFSSKDKYESGTGWPSFTKPLVEDNIVEREDNTLFTTRTEVRSKLGNNHLGHVFSDGPEPTGLRYCMNSAAMRFVAVEDLEKEGYGEWLGEFE